MNYVSGWWNRIGLKLGEAITQMDQVTQQNATLVEEMAAAADSLKSQAEDLVQTVSVFKLNANDTHHTVATSTIVKTYKPASTSFKGAAVKPRSHTPTRSLFAPMKTAKAPVSAGVDGDWETL